MTAAVEDRAQARIDGLLEMLRHCEANLRRSYSQMLDVVADLDSERAGAVAGFGTTARLLAGVLNLSTSEAKTRAEQAELLAPRRSLTGEVLPPALPASAAELAAGSIGPGHLRVITATMRRIPPTVHPGLVAQAEQTLADAARRFDPAALSRIGERLLAHLDPDGDAPVEEPEQLRELRVRTGPDGTVRLSGRLDPEGGARVLEVLNSLNTRRAPVAGVPDQRSTARRNADALVEAMSGVLDEGELPTRGGQRPHLVLTMSLSDLIEGLGPAVLDTGGRGCAPPRPAGWPAMPAWCPWCWAVNRCPWMWAASNAWPPPRCATLWPTATRGAASPRVTARPVTARHITSCPGSTAERRHSPTCVCYANTITPSCTAKAGRSGSMPAATPNSHLHQ